MENVSRRDFGKKLFSSLLTYTLLKTAFEQELFAQAIRPTTDRWLRGIHELCGDLRTNKVSQTQWQERIGQLHSSLPLPELLKFLDFEKLERLIEVPEGRVRSEIFTFPKLDWLPEADERGWGMPVFAIDRGAAVTPHGHYNMVSAHLVLKGTLRVRHFDRVGEEAEHWVIRPTIDQVSGPGEETSISEQKDNVHWLQNVGREKAFTLDVVAAGLDQSLPYSFRQTFLDPAGGEKLSDGLIRARKISYAESEKLYMNA
jgi:hypothetical protein